jgi:hypothetical protein
MPAGLALALPARAQLPARALINPVRKTRRNRNLLAPAFRWKFECTLNPADMSAG